MKHLIRKLFCAFLLLAQVFTYVPASADSDGFAIHFLDVGQADAAVILCDGEVLMIDGGNADDSSFVYSYLKNTLGINHIDTMIATHPHEDHIGGLSGALNACSVDTLYSPVTEYDSKVFSSLLKYAEKQGLSLTGPTVGDTFSVGSATVTFLAPVHNYDEPNDMSLVVRIQYGDTSFLFTGDAEWDSEHDMISNGAKLSSTLLKVGHHGSASSTSYVFLREIMPQYAVISVGANNSYGHPTDDALSRLRDADVELFRTDMQGTIICTSDGNSLSFTTEKQVSDHDSLYMTTDEQASATAATSYDYRYVLNTSSKKFHLPSCASAGKIKDGNKAYSSDDPEDLVARGYEPCGQCKPYTVKATAAPASSQQTGTQYILNTSTKKFHYPSCSSVKQMKDKNKKSYTGSRDDLIRQGYDPCGKCKP